MAGFLSIWSFAGIVLLWWILSWTIGLFDIRLDVGFVEGLALILVIVALYRINEIDKTLRERDDDFEEKLAGIESRVERIEGAVERIDHEDD